jgi:hypothetical protein
MSYETKKQKIRTLWESHKTLKDTLNTAVLKQGNTEKVIKTTQSVSIINPLFYTLTSDWLNLEDTLGLAEIEDITQQFSLTLTVPNIYIPFVTMEVAYQRTDGIDPGFNENDFWIGKFAVIERINDQVSKVIWKLSVLQHKADATLFDYLFKFYITIILPDGYGKIEPPVDNTTGGMAG